MGNLHKSKASIIRIAVVTVGRSDFSILLPLCKELDADPKFDFGLWVGGAHYDQHSGNTIDEVRKTNLPIWHEIKTDCFGSTNSDIARIMAKQIEGFAEAAIKSGLPDIVLILGDRYEAVSASLALTPFNIPIGHISGGSVTHGAIDDAFRHCITKLSRLHFCEIDEYANRIRQLGEIDNSIHVVGALGLDGIQNHSPSSIENFCDNFGLPSVFQNGFILATLHPETYSIDLTGPMVQNMILSIEETDCPVIYTYPNADPNSDIIIDHIERAAEQNDYHVVVKNFGAEWFYTAMKFAKLVIGNSSSGIIEAGSFALPVVDIGYRQAGRYHGLNVVHSGITKPEILNAIRQCMGEHFNASLTDFQNPYGDGKTSQKIINILKNLNFAELQKLKIFADHQI